MYDYLLNRLLLTSISNTRPSIVSVQYVIKMINLYIFVLIQQYNNHLIYRLYIDDQTQPMKASQQNLNQPLLTEENNPPPQQPRPVSLNFFAQAWLLIYKNVILTIKNPKNLLFLIITPFLLSAFMAAFQSLARSNGSRTLQSPPQLQFAPFGHCYGQDCISLDYRIISSSSSSQNKQIPLWVQYIIEYISEKSSLQNNKDIVHNGYITSMTQLQQYYQEFKQHQNRTQIGLLFCNGKPDEQDSPYNLSLFCNGTSDYSYYMTLNRTDSLTVIFYDLLQPLPIDESASSLKIMVDNAILNYIQNRSITQQPKIQMTHSQFPIGPNRYIKDYDIVTTIGAFYYMITPLFAFLFIQSEIVREKQYKLRQGLNIFGASHGAYWISWFVVAVIYSIVASVATYVSGVIFGFGFYTDTNPAYIILALMVPFTLAMQMFSFFLSTLAPSLKAANAVSYGIVLFAIVVQSFVADNNLLKFLFSQEITPLITFLKTFLLFYPPFSYTKIFTNITDYSGYHFDFGERIWKRGVQDYDWGVYSESLRDKLPFGSGYYERYSDLTSTLILLGDCVFYILLTWYFDILIASNRGRGESIFFPFKWLYRFIFKKSQQRKMINSIDLSKNPKYLLQDEQQSTIKQRNRVFRNAGANIPALGLRIKCLSKTFKKLFSKNKVEAIKNFNLQIEPNQLMGILGHNGAGKTTLINILTGVISPDEQPDLQIIINNRSIQKIDEIRKYIGVCSQFDILWGQLTAEDHLYMFARLKNIPQDQINQKIDQMLAFVNLSKEKKNKVASFSGGMKRRLSLAISAIGNPKIILLDQPTTGLDPKVRQQVWQLIEKLKQGKSIILTTHSMEEADILADRLSVMVKGKLKCVGTSFYLKHKYGQGHRITLNLDSKAPKNIFDTIKRLFPTAIEVDNKGGNLIIGMQDFETMLKMVKMLQSPQALGLEQYALKNSIKDWNVSHSTLEEVFMKVTKEKDQ